MRINRSQAQLLLVRSGFQPTAEEVFALEDADWDDSVTRLVEQARQHRSALTPPPAWVDDPILRLADLSLAQQRQYAKRMKRQGDALRAWWAQQMLTTPAPLVEHMTLFWHGHFTSELRKLRWPQLAYRQNALLRREALGNYRRLLHAIARDGAMLLYLDNQRNRKGRPNENFARELLELFTLGEGHYTEHDVREAARAFTGWRMRLPDGHFAVQDTAHDAAEKRFLGRSGRFDGTQVIEIILEQPQAARFIVEKLWREFVSPQPDGAAVTRLAAVFRRDWELAPLIAALLREPALRAPENRGTLVKSPSELTVGTSRLLKLDIPPQQIVSWSTRMGQRLLDPPNVRGWRGGEDWINSHSLLLRRAFVDFIAGEVPAGPQPESSAPGLALRNALRRQLGAYAESMPVIGMESVLLPLPPLLPPAHGAAPRERLASWLLDPVYQLK